MLYVLDPASAQWAHDAVVVPLNNIVRQAALWNNWVFVDGIASQFANNGECAEEARWINTEEDARFKQGPWSLITWAGGRTGNPFVPGSVVISPGTLHPNDEGYGVYSRRISYYMKNLRQISAKASLAPGAHTGVATTVTFHVQDFFAKPLQGTVRIAKDPAEYPTDTPIPYMFHGAAGELYDFSLVTADGRTTYGNFSVPIGKLTATIDPPGPTLGVPVTVTVRVVDAQTGGRVSVAMVKINDQDQFLANAPFTYTFKCGKQRPGVSAPIVCDNVVVSAPDYKDAEVSWSGVIEPP